MKDKNIWACEIKKLVKSPMYFCYILGLLLVYVLPYQNFIWKNESMNVLAAGDSLGYLLARGFGDFFGSFLVVFPAFVVAMARYRDLREQKKKPLTTEAITEPPVFVCFLTQVALLFLPVLVLSVVEAARLGAPSVGTKAPLFVDRLRFLEISLVWLLPTILAVTAVAQMVLTLTRKSYLAILVPLVLWVFTTGSTGPVGDYSSCLAIRYSVENITEYSMQFATFMANRNGLWMNRGVIVFLSLALVCVTSIIQKNRKNGSN